MSRQSAVTVAGAGAMGLTAALRLALAGLRVTLCDPSPPGEGASGVAAGMLAPVFERLLDKDVDVPAGLLEEGRDLWPGLIAEIGAEPGLIDRSGAVLALFEGEPDFAATGLERLDAAALRGLQPGLAPDVISGLYTPGDWRLDPPAMLAVLAAAFERAGGRRSPDRLELQGGRLALGGDPLSGPVVLALGAGWEGFVGAAPELGLLTPIKGQILHFSAPPHGGPTVRGAGRYVTPHARGAAVGATMEPGLRDLTLDPQALAVLRKGATRLFPLLADAPARALAGVRASTPDGLPLVGRAADSGAGEVILCTGARRNGWLWAPMAAEGVLQALLGGSEHNPFDPTRFAQPGFS